MSRGLKCLAENKHENTAYGTHEIYDSVCLGAQRLYGHVGHKRYRRRAECRHSDQNDKKNTDEGYDHPYIIQGHAEDVVRDSGDRAVCLVNYCLCSFNSLCISRCISKIQALVCAIKDFLSSVVSLNDTCVYKSVYLISVKADKRDKRADGRHRAHYDKGRASSSLGHYPIRQSAKQGEHKHREDVVYRHYRARGGLVESEVVGKDQGDDSVISLPECADKKERHSDEHDSLVIELHCFSSV